MKLADVRVLGALLFLCGSLSVNAEIRLADSRALTPELLVHVYNYAAVAPAVLAGAKNETVRILGNAGVTLGILNCLEAPAEAVMISACDHNLHLNPIYVNLLPDDMADAGFPARGDGFLGSSVGNRVAVFVGRIRQVRTEGQLPEGVVLGHVMAHEIGHLILGENSHAPGGIMKPAFGPNEWERAVSGRLRFDAEQAQRIQAQVWNR